jgi:hypothetical protein
MDEYEPPAFQALANSRVKIGRVGQTLLWLAVPILSVLAITHQSLWMDEGFTVWFAAHGSLGSFFSALMGSSGSTGDPQMLFYLFYMWIWTKVFGYSELALRAANVPFLLILLAAVSWATRRLVAVPNLWILLCLSPFLWFYLNDARPYVALMAFAAVAIVSLLAYLVEPAKYQRWAPWVCLASLLFALGTHILAVFLFPSLAVLILAAVLETPDLKRDLIRNWSRPVVFCSPFFLALGAFYGWASAHGVSKEIGEPGLRNLAFILYEFLGFAGLGPPRLELRENPFVQTFAPYAALLFLGMVPMLAACFFFLRARPPKLVLPLLSSLGVGVAIALGISKIEHFQVLGRHMAVFFPLLLVTILFGAGPFFSLRSGRFAAISSICGIALVWGISDARLVLLHKYAKDNFREAATIAETAVNKDGARIVWVADTHAAEYYGISANRSDRPTRNVMEHEVGRRMNVQAVNGQNWSFDVAARYVDSSVAPAILVLSRPDLFDKQGAWRSLVGQRKAQEIARIPAFSIYKIESFKGEAVDNRRAEDQLKVSSHLESRLIGHMHDGPNHL